MLDDNLSTETSQQQTALEKKLLALYQELDSMEPEDVTECLRLLRTVHVAYLHSGLGKLPAGFSSLDASRPWIVFWLTHSLALLGADTPAGGPSAAQVVQFLKLCQAPGGGFGGGPMQIPHLAPTYAAVAALIDLGGEVALQAVDRAAMDAFLRSLIIPPERGGGFAIHHGGETDLRSCYLAIATASLLSLDVADLATQSGVVDYIRRCQTYEGGLGGEPFNEAHGGYTYCGVAALCLLGCPDAIDLPALLHWAAHRQCGMEGGFMGRTNKLVDGCYSFWQGALFAVMQRLPQACLHAPKPDLAAQPQQQQQQAQAPRAQAAASGEGGGGGASGMDSSGPADAGAAGLPIVSVPPLPLIVPKNPVEQAAAALAQRQAVAQQVISLALQAGDRADASLQTGTERSTAGLAAEARSLLDQASAAQAAAETAHFNVSSAGCSACMLFPVPDVSDPPLPTQLVLPGGKTLPVGPPLFNFKALQLWVLRCCQQLRGGLKDKPGKPPDYYHTCYCLSGLSQAQHASNAVLGPRENLLKRADPLLNVVEDKLEAARRYFAAHPLSTDGSAQPAAAASGAGGGAAAAGGAAAQAGLGATGRDASTSSFDTMRSGSGTSGTRMDLDP